MLRDAAALVSVILGASAILATLGRFLILGPLTRLIDERTHPVQPNSNGGLSLPDVARTVTRIEHSLDVLDKKWSKHIDWHMEQK